jgi:hypothetical protein
MDITALAHDITITIVPLLPYLLKAGETAAEETGKKIAEGAWEAARKVWSLVWPQIERTPTALAAATEAAEAPDDRDAQAALRFQLKKLLAEDESFAQEVSKSWEHAKAAGIHFTLKGDRNIAVAGDVNDGTLITGDQNVVKR